MSQLKKNKNDDVNATVDVDDIGLDDTFGAEDEDNPRKKKKKEKKEREAGEKKSKWLGFVIFGVIVAALAGFAVAVVQFNALGLRDNQLRDILESVPIVNNMLPPLEGYDYVAAMSVDELVLEIERLEALNRNLSTDVSRLESLNSDLLGEIRTLQPFQENHAQFTEAREAFEREVALENPVAYEAFFRQIREERAEEIFREIAGISNHNAEVRSFISTYTNMDASSVAPIFDRLLRTDIELLLTILRGMSAQQRAEILAALPVNSAEQITRRMAPVAPETP